MKVFFRNMVSMQAQRKCSIIFKVVKEGKRNHQTKIMFPFKLSFRHKGEIKTFSEKQK